MVPYRPTRLPEATEFLTTVQVAAINAMTSATVMCICSRIQRVAGGEVGRRTVLGELEHIGVDVLRLWPGIGRLEPESPLGIWPLPPDADNGPAKPSAPAPLAPPRINAPQ